MKTFWVPAWILIGAVGMSGCQTQVIPKPGEITLEAALEEVASGINKMYAIRQQGKKSGLIPSEVSVVFNVSAKAESGSKLYIEAGANVAEALKVAKVGGEAATTIHAERGNQVTVKFTNILLAPKETLLTMTADAPKLKALLDVIKEQNIDYMLTQ